MDLDALSAVREPRWRRLRELTGLRSRTGAEADELATLYQGVAADLSTIRSVAPEPSLVLRLSVLVANARVWLTGAHTISGRAIVRYFTKGLAAALYRVRWWSVATTLAVTLLATVVAIHTVNSPEALELVGDAERRALIAEQEFASYYTEYDNTTFAARVWSNNAWLAAQCLMFGITLIMPLVLLYNTVFQLGVAAAIMAEHDMLDIFFGLMIPHGLLELSAVFVAAGAGLRLFWTMLVPGARTRGRALAEEGRAAVGVALGLAITLFISGLIEGYVTPSPVMPWWLKIAIGAVAFAAFWVYTWVVGGAAVREGVTGDQDGEMAVDVAPVAA